MSQLGWLRSIFKKKAEVNDKDSSSPRNDEKQKNEKRFIIEHSDGDSSLVHKDYVTKLQDDFLAMHAATMVKAVHEEKDITTALEPLSDLSSDTTKTIDLHYISCDEFTNVLSDERLGVFKSAIGDGFFDDLDSQFTTKNNNGDAQEIWDSLGDSDDRYDSFDFGINYSSSSLGYAWKNQFVVFVDNPLFQMGVEKTYDNALFELDDGTTLGCSIALGENGKVWDPREDSKLKLECDFQLGFDLGSRHEMNDYLPAGPPDMKYAKEEIGEDCIWSVMTLGDTIFSLDEFIHGDFYISDFERFPNLALELAGNFITAARKGSFQLVTYVALENGHKYIIYMFDNPSFRLSDVVQQTIFLWGWF